MAHKYSVWSGVYVPSAIIDYKNKKEYKFFRTLKNDRALLDKTLLQLKFLEKFWNSF